VDAVNLDYAHLLGAYPLQTYDQYGNPTGPVEWTVITADVLGQGDIFTSQDSYAHHEGDCYYLEVSRTSHRAFTATGSENGNDLGSTSQGIFQVTRSTTRQRGCGPSPEPPPGS
jgi:hypothetical protein